MHPKSGKLGVIKRVRLTVGGANPLGKHIYHKRCGSIFSKNACQHVLFSFMRWPLQWALAPTLVITVADRDGLACNGAGNELMKSCCHFTHNCLNAWKTALWLQQFCQSGRLRSPGWGWPAQSPSLLAATQQRWGSTIRVTARRVIGQRDSALVPCLST